MRSTLSTLFLVALLALCVSLSACATGEAGAGSADPTHSHSGGVIAVAGAETVTTTVTVSGWPVGMEKWSPEQLATFVAARGAAGNPGGIGDMFYSRQDVHVGKDQAGGVATADNRVPVTTSLQPPEGAGAAAAEALGLAQAAAKALEDEEAPPADEEGPAEQPPAPDEPEPAPADGE